MGSVPQLSIVKGVKQDFEPKLLHRIFEDNLPYHEEKVALIYNDEACSQEATRQWTYKDMNAKANQMARLFVEEARSHYAQPNRDGDYIVAVCMQPSDNLVVALLSVWKAGASYLPIDPSFPANRVKHILQEAGPILVIRDDAITESDFEDTPSLAIGEALIKSKQFDMEDLQDTERLAKEPNNLAIVLYTSGSTGVPKGVRLPHDVILNRLQWQWNTFPYSITETVGVFKTSLTFVDSISELWGPLLSGLAILVLPKEVTKDPERLVHVLEEYKIRRLVLVPTLLRSLLMYLNMGGQKSTQNKLLHNLHIWVCSGEPLSVQLAQSFFDYFEEGLHILYNFYGSTEVMGDVTYFQCESKKQLNDFDRVPIGTPVSNTIIYLLDSDYRPVQCGEIGEIFVSGSNLASGYVNGRDAERFIENPLADDCKYSRLYRTGDFGSLFNSHIMYEGRTDSQIKIRGHRVDLSEVERNIAELSIVEKVIVLCYHPGQIDQALLAFVKLSDDAPLINELQLEGKLQDKLSEYMTPQVLLIDVVPLLPNGKIDRQALLKAYETTNNNEGDSSIIVDYDYSGVPVTLRKEAQDLFETVGGVIGRSARTTLSVHSNFYEVGGNSLNSIFTVSLLREKGYYIGISEFIAARNLGDILERMVENCNTDMEENWLGACPNLDMEALPLADVHKDDVVQIIVDSFYGKADLEQWLKPHFVPDDYRDVVLDNWSAMLKKNLSFVVRDRQTNRIIGTALYEARYRHKGDVHSKLKIVFDFLEYLEAQVRDTYFPKGLNNTLGGFMMGTSSELNPKENIACINFMEDEVLKLGKSKGYDGIMTVNTSPLTQQIGSKVFKYKTLLDYQVNQYVYTDGTRPYGMAPDDQRAMVQWKDLNKL